MWFDTHARSSIEDGSGVEERDKEMSDKSSDRVNIYQTIKTQDAIADPTTKLKQAEKDKCRPECAYRERITELQAEIKLRSESEGLWIKNYMRLQKILAVLEKTVPLQYGIAVGAIDIVKQTFKDENA